MHPDAAHIKALVFGVFGTCVDFRTNIMHDYLRSAAAGGLKTAFVRRPHEFGRNKSTDLADDPAFTFNANDFLDLASQPGC